jgi:cation transport ATPase
MKNRKQPKQPDDTRLLDESEQDEVIQQLQQDVTQQEQDLKGLVIGVCLLAAIISLLLPWWWPYVTDLEHPTWRIYLQAVVSVGLHWNAVLIATAFPNVALSKRILYIHALLFAVLVALIGTSENALFAPVLLLIIGVLGTTFLSFLLRWDAQSSITALNDLRSSTYQYKSL